VSSVVEDATVLPTYQRSSEENHALAVQMAGLE